MGMRDGGGLARIEGLSGRILDFREFGFDGKLKDMAGKIIWREKIFSHQIFGGKCISSLGARSELASDFNRRVVRAVTLEVE